MAKIKRVMAREILDSRGNPTVEVEVLLDSGRKAWASVPSGASTGSHEALELRDGDKKRYGGKGVLKAVANVNNKISPQLIGLDPRDQEEIDQKMIDLDGTKNKSNLGANSILGVSLAVARAAAIGDKKSLYAYLRDKFWPEKKNWNFPKPMMNILNGGAHAGWSIDIQEFMVIPQQTEAGEYVRCGAEIFAALKGILKDNDYITTVGDEGGYAPKLPGNDKAMIFMAKAVAQAGYKLGQDVKFGIDAAASEFFADGVYEMKTDRKKRNVDAMIKMYQSWVEKYPIETLEDGLAEDDWSGWRELTKTLGKKIFLVGDDLFVTNVKRLERGIKERVANTILIKLNQIGSLSETVACIKLAQKNKYKVAVSHRSGETVDDFISDLAVASGAQYIKTGSLCRGERVAKYNRLMEIEQKIKSEKRKV